jgi:phosphomannomutase
MNTIGKAFLKQEPRELKFGTSGLRGFAVDLTDLECYINILGFISYLKSISADDGGISDGAEIFLAGDYRPSTPRIMKAVGKAIIDSGCKIKNCGNISVPAVTYCGMRNKCASIMVTGSHIPEDMNGIKPNKTTGEVLKSDEIEMGRYISLAREKVYETLGGENCLFNENGALVVDENLPEVDAEQAEVYIKRYTDIFPSGCLAGKKIVVYQHSSVGRDIVTEIFRRLGAEIIVEGRTDQFVSVDTEAIKEADLNLIKQYAERHNPFAIISFDGDCDRPWLSSDKGDFLHGSLLGGLTVLYLKADFAAVPISCNDAVDEMLMGKATLVKTRIGSPYVIRAMMDAAGQGFSKVVSWEINGGFLTCSDLDIFGKKLTALPTRDSVLPMLCVIVMAVEKGVNLSDIIEELPKRFISSDKIKEFPNEAASKITGRYSPIDKEINKMEFKADGLELVKNNGEVLFVKNDSDFGREWLEKKKELEEKYLLPSGIGRINSLVYTDGVRIYVESKEVIHLRQSNNAPEFRCYANAGSQDRANELVGVVLKNMLPKMRTDLS